MRLPPIVRSGKQVLLLAVAGLLSVSGAIAVGILLFGEFGQTEGRVLATTGLLAAYGLLALPAAMLVDRRRLPVLAVLVLTLALAGALLAVSAVWRSSPSDAHGNAVGTVTAFLVASAQVSALVLRRPDRDRTLVRWLFALSCLFAAVAAAMFTVVLWAEIDSERYGRVLAAVVVLDILAVALQPTLARARPHAITIPLRLLLESGETREVGVLAPDLAAAAADAIRQSEREGHRVVRLEVAERH
ncbi:MAG: hypothetical protein WD380_08075 [Gaiellaceae bacterium]